MSEGHRGRCSGEGPGDGTPSAGALGHRSRPRAHQADATEDEVGLCVLARRSTAAQVCNVRPHSRVPQNKCFWKD